jgi:NTP pyrophosphatase (non-canonical NTP hydrolase)
MKKIQERIDEINIQFLKIEGNSADLKTLMLKKVLKIGEEYGELCDAMLSEIGSQRKSKLKAYDSQDFKDEFADVIITALTLARYMDMDLESLVNKKLDKIEDRLKSDY